MTVEQLSIDDVLLAGVCEYGKPERRCDRPATHGARWSKDGAAGGLDCCLAHANYYAVAWCPRFPGERAAAWIEVLA